MKLLFVFAWLFFLDAAYARSQWTTLRVGDGAAEFSTCSTIIGTQFSWKYGDSTTTTNSHRGHGKRAGRNTSSTPSALCAYPPAVGTALFCAFEYANYNKKTMKNIYDQFVSYCSNSTYDVDYFKKQYENATLYYQPYNGNFSQAVTVYYPTLPDLTAGEETILGIRTYYTEVDNSTWFAVGIVGFFAFFSIIGGLYTLARASGYTKTINQTKFAKFCQKYIIFPTVIPHGRYSTDYGWKYFSILVPNRVQFLLDFLLFVLHIGIYCSPYHIKEGAYYFDDNKRAWTEFLGYRSGVMAFGMVPLIVLFAGRNNFLMYVTGWSYTTFLHFHKTVAIWMCIDAIIHSAVYTDILGSSFKGRLSHQLYLQAGVAATVLGCVMSAFAFHAIRKNYYEIFLNLHILMGAGFIAMCWYHCVDLGWCEWLVAAIAVWGFDRAVRIIRMTGFGYRNATLTVVDDELIQVVTTRPKWWTTSSGQFAFLYFGGWLFWQSHPFTVVCKEDKIYAYIKVKKGLTKYLWRRVKDTKKPISWKICIEGPYPAIGNSGVRKMDETLIFAGGSGSPGMLDTASEVKNGKLIWVLPTLAMAKAYSSLLQHVKIPISVHITKESGESHFIDSSELFAGSDAESSTDAECKSSDQEKAILFEPSSIEINYGRPSLPKIFDHEINSSSASSIGITACGPPKMMDQIRNLVANGVTKYDKSFDFFDELQVW